MNPAGPTVRIEPEGVEISAPSGLTILQALQQAGFTMFFGCRRGGCGVCRTKLEVGQVNMGPFAEQALPSDLRQQGYVLACRAQPCGDVVIRVDEANRLKKVRGWEWWNRRQGPLCDTDAPGDELS